MIRPVCYALLCAVAVAVAAPSHLAAQGKGTLWTEVSSSTNIVRLAWDNSHPWDALLTTSGAELVARYVTDGGREVTETLGRGTRVPDRSRAVEFVLPGDLRGAPSGPVCLAIQLPDRRVLPIRRAQSGDLDTAGFRYQAWGEQIHQRTQARALDRSIEALQRALEIATANTATAETTATARGWTDEDACAKPVAMPTGTPVPFDVVPPDRQDDEARRVCVARVREARQMTIRGAATARRLQSYEAQRDVAAARRLLFSEYSAARVLEASALLARMADQLGPDHPVVREYGERKRRFDADWSRFSASTGRPLLGTRQDEITWPSEGWAVAFRLLGGIDFAREMKAEWAITDLPDSKAEDLVALLGAAFTAYEGCVDDANKQLRLKYDSFQAYAGDAPQRARAQQQFFERECRQGLADRNKLRAEREAFARDLRARQAERTALASARPLPSRREMLNGSRCDGRQ